MYLSEKYKLAVVGLGYVGLPLAVEFGLKRKVIGFDINIKRIKELKKYNENTKKLSLKKIKKAKHLKFTNKVEDLVDCNIYIITVPTPINSDNSPDLRPIMLATKTIAKLLKSKDIVIYESTVYPGATEEDCVPVLEKLSGLKFNKDFFCGYSPERINPGDKKHQLKNILKVVSGSTSKTLEIINALYNEIIVAGTHKAPSIRVAEAAKVIENTQRDLNIALINELAIIFKKMNIDTQAVLAAASTKWNFLTFRPGLVGGHCIGVDPYYLTHKAQKIGYKPKIILAGRKLNDSMGVYAANQLVQEMKDRKISFKKSKILILGLAFKENCRDLRNTKIVSLAKSLIKLGCSVDIFDPLVNIDQAKKEYNLVPISNPKKKYYDAAILAVSHTKFLKMGTKKIKSFCKSKHIFYDLKYLFKKHESDLRL